jgi:hypothetical protein
MVEREGRAAKARARSSPSAASRMANEGSADVPTAADLDRDSN